MHELFQNLNINICIASFVTTTLLFHLMVSPSIIKVVPFLKFLRINAKKSSTNALVLGGLPIAFSSVLYVTIDSLIKHEFNASFYYWIVSSIIILFYGYVDDRYEIRPIFKLLFQALAIFVLTFNSFGYNSNVEFPLMQFFLFFLIGVVSLNGANLIDGLDTLSVKLVSVVYLTFFLLGHHFGVSTVSNVSILCLVPLFSFYFYNKSPAKIYLGEIGSSFIGVTCFFISITLFKSLHFESGKNYLNSLSISLLPLSLFLMEVTVSFFRRIVKQQSPFVGDKKHLHHLLMFKVGLTAEKASTLLASIYFVLNILSVFSISVINPVMGYIYNISMFICVNYFIGFKIWFHGGRTQESEITIKNNHQNILVIGKDVIDDFDIIDLTVNDEEETTAA